MAVPFFVEDDATKVTLICDPVLPLLLALRALVSGARVQVVTARPASWQSLRRHGDPGGRLTVVRPGTQPPADATRADPWMIIDDTGSAATAGGRPWQTAVTVLSATGEFVAVQAGQDAILMQRTGHSGTDAVATALGMSPGERQSLQQMPEGIVAVARRGTPIRFARLDPDPAESSIVAAALQAGQRGERTDWA